MLLELSPSLRLPLPYSENGPNPSRQRFAECEKIAALRHPLVNALFRCLYSVTFRQFSRFPFEGVVGRRHELQYEGSRQRPSHV